jgi:hypothetical protein
MLIHNQVNASGCSGPDWIEFDWIELDRIELDGTGIVRPVTYLPALLSVMARAT